MTQFEEAWKRGMFDQDVRQHLAFLQGGFGGSTPSSASSPASGDLAAELKKMKNRLAATEDQLRGAKRKIEAVSGKGGKGDKGRGKGKKGSGKGTPEKFAGMNTKHNGKNICYGFNENRCPFNENTCRRGLHLCMRCHQPGHSMDSPSCPKR